MSPQATIGGFRLLEVLGRGGMGVVYRAVPEDGGPAVALKTVLAPEGYQFDAIRREIRSLSRLSHPNVVRVHAQGVEDGAPWYAMEMVSGVTLREFMSGTESVGATEATVPLAALPRAAATSSEPAPVDPERRSRNLEVLRALCHPLAYMHGEGLIHRDLKPENIIVRPEGPVIVDFGIAIAQSPSSGRESLEFGFGASGTVSYMAPEQARGGLIDARADLYALGCILYEILTGHVPFSGESPASIILKHCTAVPDRPSSTIPDIDPALDHLVMALLAKDPRDRPSHALEVAAALPGGGATDGRLPPPRPYLYRPRLAVGDGLPEKLHDMRSRAASGRGFAVVVVGEEGAGKTRIGLEMGTDAAERGFRVLSGRCVGGGAPLHPLRELLQELADRCRGPEPQSPLWESAGFLAPYDPDLSHLVERSPDRPLPLESGRVLLWRHLWRVLAELESSTPILLLIDDVQWADELTAGFLRFLSRTGSLAGRRILVVLTSRPEAAETWAKVWDGPDDQRIELGVLRPSEVDGMVGDMLAAGSSPEPLRRTLERTNGNPLFLTELLRWLVERGCLERAAEGGWRMGALEEATLPRSISELLLRRSDDLSGGGTALLRAVSILGLEAESAQLARVAGLDEPDMMDALSELLSRGLVEHRVTDDGRTLVFTSHDALQREVAVRIPPPEVAAWHRRAAEMLASLGEARRASTLARQGRHWRLAGEGDRAAEVFLRGAERAVRLHALQDAEHMYRQYLELIETPSENGVRARIALGVAVLRFQGKLSDARRQLELAAEEAGVAEVPELLPECLSGVARLEMQLGNPSRARERYEEAAKLAAGAGDARLEAQILGDLANLLRQTGDLAQAHRLLRASIDRCAELGDRVSAARGESNLALVLKLQGRLDEALDLLGTVRRQFADLGMRSDEGMALTHLVSVSLHAGRYADAVRQAEEALTIHKETGLTIYEATTLHNVAIVFTEQGRLAEARSAYERALRLEREAGNRAGEGATLGDLGNVLTLEGRRDEAEEHYRRALAIHREVGDPRSAAIVLGALAELKRDDAELDAAEGLVGEALELAREVGAIRLSGYLLATRGSIERSRGDLEAAGRSGREAVTVLESVGDRIERAKALCLLGHTELAAGRPAREMERVAADLAAELEVDEASQLGRALARLRQAIEVFEAGGALDRGMVPVDDQGM